MKKIGLIGLSMLLLAGCGPDDVDTGVKATNEQTKQEVKAEKADEKRFKANASTEALGVKVNIAEVVIKPDRIEVGMNLKNTNSDQVTWWPDQEGKIVVGDKQLNANMFMGDSVGGEIAGGVKQNGVLTFLTNNNDRLDPKSVKEIKMDLGEVMSSDFMNTKKVEFEIKVQ